jgi:hypothetical protein
VAKEEGLFGEARVRDNVGFADCREAAIVCFRSRKRKQLIQVDRV